MDANGGCGLVLSTIQSVCQTPYQALHYCLYYIKLWLVNTNAQESILFACMCTGIPFLYMLVVVPLGLLVNTDSTGHHYGQYNTHNKERLA